MYSTTGETTKNPSTAILVSTYLAVKTPSWANKTLAQARSFLGRFTRWSEVIPEHPSQVADFLASIKGQPETVDSYFRVLRTFYRWLERAYEIPNPFGLLQAPRLRPKVRRVLDIAQLHHLLTHPIHDLRTRALLYLLVDSGCRIGEAASLTRPALATNWATVKGKSGEREVPISISVRDMLLALPQHQQNPDALWWGRKGRMTAEGLKQLVQKAFQRADIRGPKHGPHTLRHSFATAWIVNGGDLKSLQDILGHQDIKTTALYLHLNKAILTQHHQRYSPLAQLA